MDKYASRRPTFLFTTLLYLLELLDLVDRLRKPYGFGPYVVGINYTHSTHNYLYSRRALVCSQRCGLPVAVAAASDRAHVAVEPSIDVPTVSATASNRCTIAS